MPPQTTWQFYLCAEDAWNAMYDACLRAEKSIKFEQFIFLPDWIGKRFTELLIRKAKAGVSVSLLADCGGSYALYNSPLEAEMRAAGIKMVFFNRISPWRLHNLRLWFFRDHRKILVVDGKEAYMGGVGIADFMRGWRDTHFKIEGDIVTDIDNSFDRMWKMSEREKFMPFPKPKQNPSGFSLLTSAPHIRQRFIYGRVVAMIRSAQKYIYITTPYFVPDTRLFRVLRLAAKRGVDVRILLPSSSDHPYVDWASRFHFNKALHGKIRIWQYDSMLHSKSIVIDDSWTSVGSSNMDNYSFFFNYEANIISLNQKFAEEVKGHFLSDLAKAKELDLRLWQKRGFYDRILETISTPFAKFL